MINFLVKHFYHKQQNVGSISGKYRNSIEKLDFSYSFCVFENASCFFEKVRVVTKSERK